MCKPRCIQRYSKESKYTGKTAEEIDRELVNSIPLGRLGIAEDLVNLVVFLCSDYADYITGQAINVDGGQILSWAKSTSFA